MIYLRRMPPSTYNPLDDVPHSVRQNISQASPSYSIVTDSSNPDGQQQSQVMSPNAPITPILMHAAAASADQVQMRLQQMIQLQAPADVIRMLHGGHEVNADAKTVRDVQNNVHRVASELEARTERLAACLSSLTCDIETVRAQSETLYQTANEPRGFLTNADTKLTDLFNRLQHLEQAVAQLSRGQVTFESSMTGRLEALEHGLHLLQSSSSTADALQGGLASMKAAISKLEVLHQESKERTNDIDVRLKLAMERVVSSERVCERLRKTDTELEEQMRQLSLHLDSGMPQQTHPQEAAAATEQGQEETPSTPKNVKQRQAGVEEFQLTPQQEGTTWSQDQVDDWYDHPEPLEATFKGPGLDKPLRNTMSSPPGIPSHMKKSRHTEVPPSAWKLLKDMPQLRCNAAEPWERGMAFRQWTTEVAAVAEAIHSEFAEFFRQRLTEGQQRYQKRIEQGFADPLPSISSGEKEFETRLSLVLIRILPAKMKQHALERGSTHDGISTAALLESVYESMTPGGIREKSSLLQYLRAPPPAGTGEELMAGLRRYRLAQQRAKQLAIPDQAAHESIAALDHLVKPIEKKHQALSVRLGIMRLQANIQIPTPEGVEIYTKILEAEAMKLQAEDTSRTKPSHVHADQGEYAIPTANSADGGKGGVRLCGFYNTARGCLKGSECTFRHEALPNPMKGKGAKGEKGGGKSGEPKAKAKATAKAEAKAAAKAEAKAAAEAAAVAEAKAEAKRKAKADKKAAKAAAKAAAAAASSSTSALAATIIEEAVPSLAGASPEASSSTGVSRASMAREDVEPSDGVEEESEIISLVGVELSEEEGQYDSQSQGVSDIEGVPMYADASTPEWSDVEQGQFPSPATTPRSDSEVEFVGAMQPPAPLWVLDLTLSDYMAWTRQGHVQSYAHSSFEQETNPNSIMWPTWWTIASDRLSDDEDGTIYVVDEVCMLRCTVTMVLFEDGIIRPVFVVWLLEKPTGRERMVALIREQSRPVVKPWPRQELSKAASPKTHRWPEARAPTVPTPKGIFGDVAQHHFRSEQASSSSSAAMPKAVPKAAVPKAVPKASSTAVPKAVPKASAVAFRETADLDESDNEVSNGSPTMAMRCICLEEESMEEIPALVGIEQNMIVPKCWKDEDHGDGPTSVGAEQNTTMAHRLECTDHPAANIVASEQQPAVLVDSGANETIRPWDETINEAGCKRTSVVTASGDRVPALRTKDGELCIKSNGESRDWLLSVRRLIEAGGTFGWTQSGVEVAFRDHEGREQHIKCHIVNGLPFIGWTEFRPIRILLSKFYKTQEGPYIRRQPPTLNGEVARPALSRSCVRPCGVRRLIRQQLRSPKTS